MLKTLVTVFSVSHIINKLNECYSRRRFIFHLGGIPSVFFHVRVTFPSLFLWLQFYEETDKWDHNILFNYFSYIIYLFCYSLKLNFITPFPAITEKININFTEKHIHQIKTNFDYLIPNWKLRHGLLNNEWKN